MGQAEQAGALQRTDQASSGLVAGGTVRNDFGDHGVVVRADGLARCQAVVHAHAFACGRVPERNIATLRQEAVVGIFGIQAHFDGVSVQWHLLLRQRQGLATGHGDLPGHQVQPGDALGHRVFDLQPRVHLQKVKAPFAVEQKLDGAGADIVHGARRGHRRRAHLRAQCGRDRRGGRFLEHLLVPTLDRAVALAQVDDVAVLVAEDLDFDMARLDHRALQDQLFAAEGVAGFRAGTDQGDRQVLRVFDQPHAAPAAARRRLDHDRETDLGSFREQRGIGLVGTLIARHAGHARRQHQAFGAGLVAHFQDGLRVRADEHQPGVQASLRKAVVLGQESVAGVYRISARAARRRQQRCDVEVALAYWRRADAHGLVGQSDMQR